MHTDHFEYPFRAQTLRQAIQTHRIENQGKIDQRTYRRTHYTPESTLLTINDCFIGFFTVFEHSKHTHHRIFSMTDFFLTEIELQLALSQNPIDVTISFSNHPMHAKYREHED